MTVQEKIPCSVCILTRNSAATLERALQSVKDFSEIVVCDGGSTDETRSIAQRHGARIVEQALEFLGPDGRVRDFSGVRNQLLDAAREEWVLHLDSDEYIDAPLVASITRAVHGGPAGYFLERIYVLDGKVIDCASTYPNRQMRFFSKQAAFRFIKEVHERIELRPGAPVRVLLGGHLFVPLEKDAKLRRERWRRYIAIEVSRRGTLSCRAWLRILFHHAGVSLLYFARTFRNLFCSGNRMPLSHEWERHWYHLRLVRELARTIRSL